MFRLVYSESDKHFRVVPRDRYEEWVRWLQRDEPGGLPVPSWAVTIPQSAFSEQTDNALGYFSFDTYAITESAEDARKDARIRRDKQPW